MKHTAWTHLPLQVKACRMLALKAQEAKHLSSKVPVAAAC